jgi:hypothetical protein
MGIGRFTRDECDWCEKCPCVCKPIPKEETERIDRAVKQYGIEIAENIIKNFKINDTDVSKYIDTSS